MSEQPTIHACCVVIGTDGVLIRGASGSGKSALALSLIDTSTDATQMRLVSDDRTALHVCGGALIATAPEQTAGLMEVRGLGLGRVRALPTARVSLIVDLVAPVDCPRMPDSEDSSATLAGITLPRVCLRAGDDAQAQAARVRIALTRSVSGIVLAVDV